MHIYIIYAYIDTDIAVVSSMQQYFPVWFTPPTGTLAYLIWRRGRCCSAQVMRQRGVEPTIATGEIDWASMFWMVQL